MRLFSFQITDVLADENLVADRQRNGVFQMRANSQNNFRRAEFHDALIMGTRSARPSDGDGQRRVTSRPPQNQFTVQHHTHN